jgi:hypothetical protein
MTELHVLCDGYVREGDELRVGSTVGFVRDGDALVVVDPGMVESPPRSSGRSARSASRRATSRTSCSPIIIPITP